MKNTLLRVVGWVWVVVVVYLYIAQSPRLRPPGLLGRLLNSFFSAMSAAYLG